MKATLKAMIAKGMTAGLLAGAFLLGSPTKAEAAQVNIGVQFGAPVYTAYPDYYARRQYYDRLRWEQARRAEIERQEWIRRQQWQRHEAHERWEHGRGYYGR
jgi:hypothetical protein